MAGDEQLRAGVSQQVSAHDHSQVAVAGGNIYIGVPAGQELAWLPLAAGRLPGSQRVDPTALLDSLGVDRFAGRKWLAAGVDKFIEVQEGPAGLGRGYVVVEAAAGMGKTAFAAHLARTRGYPAHFTRLPQGRSSSVALRNLAAQIAEQVNADERWNAGPVETPVAFATFLQDAAARHPGRLVFVVDGLDEADDDGAELPLGLPADLPAGVFAIVTCRSSTELSGLREPFSVLPIEARASENLDDLHTYLAQQIAAEPLAAILAGSGLSSAEFIGDLLNSCGGLWVYLKYVLDEIRTGRRSPHDVTGLPRSLGQFYADSLRPLRRDRTAWVSLHRPVLSTLAAAAEPVTVAALAALSGVDDVDAVHGFCDYLYRPFLAADEVTGRWSLYHATLQEFLTGTGPGDGASAGQARDALRRELARATQAAHHHIADRYLALFGTLDHGLARLVTDPAVADCDEAYGLRNLAEHLIAAGRFRNLSTSPGHRWPVITEWRLLSPWAG
jgi:NACHT domain-containing protein